LAANSQTETKAANSNLPGHDHGYVDARYDGVVVVVVKYKAKLVGFCFLVVCCLQVLV
jgi:hypothetical protein